MINKPSFATSPAVLAFSLTLIFGCGGGGGNGADVDADISIDWPTDWDVPVDQPIDQPIDTPVEMDVPPDTPASCSPPCTSGSCCSGSCVYLGSDTSNCGTCGHTCGGGESCIAGECQTCTPDCGTRECGYDGCRGTCGDCTSSEACIEGTCTPCTGSCAGKDCGDDDCGHSCGTCPEGQTCSEGTCVSCTPSCTGKNCGDDDGCGGYCDGDCPGGGTCDDGICVGGCVPNCSGKECGNDGCGGRCGECDYPEKCGRGGVCECTSLCSTEGRGCGFDGCGGSCGTCLEGEICADGASGAVVATYLCLDISTGCADGVREGFTNQTIYPDIASCQAAWEAQSMRTTRTGALCGNNLGPCMVPEDACAPGWHLCMKNGWPGDLADRISAEDCNSPIAGNGKFAAGSDARVGASCDCSTAYMPLPVGCTVTAPICCGTECLRDACCRDQVWVNGTSQTDASSSDDCQNLEGGSDADGVLCCQDPPVVGH